MRWGGDGRHVLIGLVDALAAFEPKREGDGVGKVAGIGGGELVIHGLGGYRTVRTKQERNGVRL